MTLIRSPQALHGLPGRVRDVNEGLSPIFYDWVECHGDSPRGLRSDALLGAVSDVGQAPKVENLSAGEATGCDEDLAGEADAAFWSGVACPGDEAGGGSDHRRAVITLDTLTYLAR